MENIIRIERARNRMTQDDLAKKVKVSRQTIHAIETNRTIPGIDLAKRIAHIFGKTTDEIFIFSDEDYVAFKTI